MITATDWAKAQQRIRDLEAANAENDKGWHDAETRCAMAEAKLSQAESQVAALEAEVDQAQRDYATLDEHACGWKQERDALRGQVAALLRDLSSATAEHDDKLTAPLRRLVEGFTDDPLNAGSWRDCCRANAKAVLAAYSNAEAIADMNALHDKHVRREALEEAAKRVNASIGTGWVDLALLRDEIRALAADSEGK